MFDALVHGCAAAADRLLHPYLLPPLLLPPPQNTATHTNPTQTAVDAPPVKVFDRTPNLAGAQIISYRASGDGKWCVLIGITPGAPERPALARGVMQLYSVEQAKSQPLEAHAAAFSTVKFAGRDAASNVIAFAQKTLKDGQVVSKLHVIELGSAPGAFTLALLLLSSFSWRCCPCC